MTGLTTAYLLLKQGIPVRVCEASDRVGGLGATFERDGFYFDFGPHELCTENEGLIELLGELCGEDLFLIKKRTAQYFRSGYVHFPFTPADVMRAFGPVLFARASCELLLAGLRMRLGTRDHDSFESWTRARFGKTLYDNYFGPYTRKVWGVDPSELDAATARDRIAGDSVFELLKKSFRYRFLKGGDERSTHGAYHHHFRYLKHGIGTLERHLLAQVEALGGQVECGKRLVELQKSNDTVVELIFEDGTTLSSPAHVVSTIPLPDLVRMSLGDEGRALCEANPLRFRGMAFVHLRLAKPNVMPYHWVYFPGTEFPFQRTTEFGQFQADMSPPGHSALTCEVATNPGEALWELPDEELVAKCVSSLRGIGVLEERDLLGFDVIRVKGAYPIQTKGVAQQAANLLQALDPIHNLTTLGRQGLFRYCNTDECMEMAMDLAPRLARGERAPRYDSPSTWRGVALTDGRDEDVRVSA